MPTRSLWSFATQQGAWTTNIQPYSIFTCRYVRVADCGNVNTHMQAEGERACSMPHRDPLEIKFSSSE